MIMIHQMPHSQVLQYLLIPICHWWSTGLRVLLITNITSTYTHFAEIQELQTSDTREFSIVWNGEVLHRQFIPPKFSAFTIYNPSPIICEGRECSLQLIRTNRSTLPPLINAHEVYTVIHFPQSETNENDGMLCL